MKGPIHFISGLPRSGSTLLAALLRQNPRFVAGMTSPVGHLFNVILRETSQRSETAVFVDDAMRLRLLRGLFDAYYPDDEPNRVVFDTNRMWTTRLEALAQLFPASRMICCVRNPAWVIDSVECLVRKNALELSGIFSFEPGGTVYSRAEGLSGPNGMIGLAFGALREAVFGPHAHQLSLVRYDSLVADPLGALAAICDFIAEPMGPHDPANIKPAYDMVEFDWRLGTPGLHDVGRFVQARKRSTILPPDIFARHVDQAFWEDLAQLPEGMKVV